MRRYRMGGGTVGGTMPGFAPSNLWIENLPLAAMVLDDEWRPQEWNDVCQRLLSQLDPDSDLSAARESLARQVMSQVGACPSDLIVSVQSAAGPPVQLRAW